MEMQKIWNSQSNFKKAGSWEKKKKVGGPILPVFKTYHKAIIIRTVQYLHTDKHVDQWNKISRNRYICGQLLFSKGTKVILQGQHSPFNKQRCSNWIAT